jgi:pimeloyl-ACP methyl ester carboxylesterase
MAINPVVFVHGIQGSWLKDEFPVDYNDAVLWTGILKKKFDALHLHQLDDTVDAQVNRLVMPHQAIPLIYESIVDEIRDEMDDQPYAYVFTYDWRKDNRLAASALSEFIERVLHITGVHEKAAKRTPPRQVVLIGHSMGGLVIKWCTTKIISSRKIARIITIATPFRGSLKAIEALLPGARNLFGIEQKKSMRHAARTMIGLYQLLPNWPKAVVDSSTSKPLNIFNVSSWQKSLVKALAEKYSPDFFSKKLADSQAFSRVMVAPWPEELVKKVYYAYGVGSETWKQVKVDTGHENFFMFNKVIQDDQGDGTVHSLSSIREEISKGSRTYTDHKHAIKDMLAGQHANMPNHSALQDWALGILRVNPYALNTFESPY